MRIQNLLIALLVILAILPTTIAQEDSVAVCTEKIGGDSCVVPIRCTVEYDEGTQERIVKCPPYYKPSIDVVFVIDSTGSMADEIRTVKTHLIKIIKEVEGGQPMPYLRVGVVAYRDHKLEEAQYLYRKFELTSNIDKAVNFIWNIEARGGGDLPEAVTDGLDLAINHMNWNNVVITQNQEVYPKPYPYTKKLIFLIGDAAPHGEGSSDHSYVQGCPQGHNYRENIKDATNKGISIYTVSGSGIESVGVSIFKEIARETGGSYTHLSYIRRNVQEYYEEEGFTPAEVMAYAAEARKDVDYDKATNSILTNTFGGFAKTSIKAEAVEMGVKYDDADDSSYEQDDDWLDADDITGEVVVETDDEEETVKESLYGFFKRIFDKIVFWR